MNAKSKKRALKAGALAAALGAVLLPTGCNSSSPPPTNPPPYQLQPDHQVSAPAAPVHTDA